MSKSLKNASFLALSVAASALLLAGCGSDDPGASSAPTVVGDPGASGGGVRDRITCPDGRALVGSGTRAAPYEIACIEQLSIIRLDADPALIQTHYLLVSDLDFSNVTTAASIIPTFNGVLDGGSHTIRNLTLRGETEVGFFGRIEDGAEVKNLTLDGVSTEGFDAVGSLAGAIVSGVLTGVSVLNASVQGYMGVGGMIGANRRTVRIEGCKTQGVNVRGWSFVGGLIGVFATQPAQEISIMKRSSSDGEVSGNETVGGLIGSSNARIADCSSAATVAGSSGSRSET